MNDREMLMGSYKAYMILYRQSSSIHWLKAARTCLVKLIELEAKWNEDKTKEYKAA